MSNTVEHQARRGGACTLNVTSIAADVQVVTSPNAGSAWVELTAVDGDANAIKAIEQAEFREQGDEVFLKLNEGSIAGAEYGGAGMQFGNGNFQSNFFGGNVSVGRGSRVVMNGISMVNGISVGRIRIRAILPEGSSVDANSTSGDVETRGVEQINARTVSGDVTAVGLTKDSNLNTVSGDVTVSAAGRDERGHSTGREVALPGGGPRINANTVSGDVTSYGVRLRAHTVSGDVRER